jgi:hypothetical protein
VLTIIWDADGRRYHQGRGLLLLIDGQLKAQRDNIGTIEVKI